MPSRYLPLAFLCVMGVLGAEPRRDRFSDPLPEGAIARLGSLRLRNEEFIFGAAFAADGKTLAVVGRSHMYFWDPVKGKLVRRMELPTVPVQYRRFSGDGKTLIQSRQDDPQTITVLDVSSGAEKYTLTRTNRSLLWHLDISGDGKIAAVAHEDSIFLWDVPGKKLLHQLQGPPIVPVPQNSAVALTPDGKQLVLPHSDGSLHVVDVATGKELRAVEMPPLRPGLSSHRNLQRLAISPDGRYLVFGGPDTPLTLSELATGKRLHELAPPMSNYFTGAAFTPNGRLVAVDEYTGIRLFEVPSGKEVRKLPLKSPRRNRLVFSPDGRMLAAVDDYTIKLWDMTENRWLHPDAGHEATIQTMHFFPDGKRLVSADRGLEMRVWDIASAQTLAQRMTYFAESLTVDKDGESVRFTHNDHVAAHHWDPRTGREEVRPKGSIGLSGTSALSADGRSLAVLTRDAGGDPKKRGAAYQLRLYDLKTSKWIALPRLPELPQWGLRHVLFSPDSRRLAARCPGDVLLLWDRDTGKRVRELKIEAPGGGQAQHLAFAADGRSFLAVIGGRIRIREVASGADRLTIPAVLGYGLAYAPDARYFACGQEDGRILVYSAVSGKQLAGWQGKQGSVRALAFSRDGRLLASGGANGTILVWKVPKDDSVPVVNKGEEADSLWQALGDSDAAAANRALAGLTAAPAQTLPLFKDRLRPIGAPLDRAQLARWIAELDDDSFKVREQATRELALLGVEALDALRQALDNNPSPEAKRRISDLLGRIKKGGNPERLRFLRALEVLERIGAPQAKELLRELADKPMADELKAEVQASLRRLGDKP